MPMSTDILRVIAGADMSRTQQSQPAARAQESRALPQGREVAAGGGQLPLPEQQVQSSEVAKVEQAVSQVNEFVQSLSRDLQFMVDEDSGRTVIKVLDTQTKEVIRQIPPEEMLRIARFMVDDESASLLLKVQA